MATTESTPDFSKLSILVLDDDESIVVLMSHILKKLGVGKVVAFDHSLEAVKYIRDNKDVIDLIFSDVEMPVCDGLELCVHLAHMNYTNPLVFVTGSDPTLKERLAKCNAVQHHLNILHILPKPVNIRKIGEVLAWL